MLKQEQRTIDKQDAGRQLLILAVLVYVCVVVRASYVFLFADPPQYIASDMEYYDRSAMQLLDGRTSMGATLRSPAYYIFLSVYYALLSAVDLLKYRYWLVPALSILLSAFAIVPLYLTTKRLSSTRAALTASIIYIIFYPLVYLNIFILSENLFVPLLITAIYILICQIESGRSWWVLVGLTLGLATVTRAIFAPFVLVCLLWLIMYYRRTPAIRVKILSLVLTTVAVIGLQIAFNYVITGRSVTSLSSSAGLNFAAAWCDVRILEVRRPGVYWRIEFPACLSYPLDSIIVTSVDFENQAYYYQMGLNCVKRDPWRLISHTKNISRLFFSQIFPDYESIQGRRTLFAISNVLTYSILLPLSGLAYFVVRRQDRKYCVLLLLLMASLFATIYTQSPGEQRYLVPYEPVFIVLGCVAADTIAREHLAV